MGLMEFETLTGDEIVGLLQGVRPVREAGDKEPPPPPRAAVPSTGKPRGYRPRRRRSRAAAADLSRQGPGPKLRWRARRDILVEDFAFDGNHARRRSP